MSDVQITYQITEILFIRHAESFNNILYEKIRKEHGTDVSEEFIKSEELRLRQSDSLLSETGHKQVDILELFVKSKQLAKSVDDIKENFDDWIFISSPMRRCLLTSGALSRGLNGKKVYVRHDLYESNGLYKKDETTGEVKGLSGATASEIESEFPNYKCFPGMEHGWYGRDVMETFAEFKTRAQSIVDWIWSVHETPPDQRQLHGVPFRHLVFVIHGNLLNAVISGLQGGQGLITHSNTGFSRIQLLTESTGRRVAVVKYLNRIDHILASSTDTDTTQAGVVSGNHTLDDHWIQELEE